MDYPGTYMNALASIRHGPIVILHETPGSSTTYHPLESMLTTIHGPQYTHPSPTRPLLPPVHILHRTSTNPPHFNATKQTEKQTHTDPKHPSRPRNPGEREPHRHFDADTVHPPEAKRPKTFPPPQQPVLPHLYDANNKGDTTADQRRADCKNESAHEKNAKEEGSPGIKRTKADDWDGKTKSQRKNWHRRHK